MATRLEESLERDIDRIRKQVLEMSALAERALRDCVEALTVGNRQQAYAVILRDQYIDEKEKEIDRLCLEFLVRQQPVGMPLRLAYSTIKINLELERVGDYAESVARQLLRLSSLPPPAPIRERIVEMANLAIPMLHDAIDAFVSQDPTLAKGVILVEPAVDALLGKLNSDLLEAFQQKLVQPEMLEPLVNIGRRFERVADQARNVCMETLYMCTGEYAKHPGADTFRILFVGEHNASRSQMAEAIAQSLGQPKFIFSSAGVDPRAIDPRTLALPEGQGARREPPGPQGDLPGPEPRPLPGHRRRRARGPAGLPAQPPQDGLRGLEHRRPRASPGLARGGARGLRGHLPLPLHPRARPRGSRAGSTHRVAAHNNRRRSPMTRVPPSTPIRLSLLAFAAALAASACGGGGGGQQAAKPARTVIQNKGSDTMVNVAQVWAEEYRKAAPDVEVEVSGGGSGVGIAALLKGAVDIANASRDIKPSEIEQAEKNTGKKPVGFTVGFDALAVYVHKDNPLNEITFEQLTDLYAEGGKTTRWSELGVKIPGVSDDTIVRVSRQSSSGTYEFFREHALGNRDFRMGSRDLNGSKEVVELVGSTLTAIGYSGMGYATAAVKTLKVTSKPGSPAVAPTVAAVHDKTYPLARSLHLYTLGEPQGAVKQYIDWILSDAGQKVVEDSGYVPVPPDQRAKP